MQATRLHRSHFRISTRHATKLDLTGCKSQEQAAKALRACNEAVEALELLTGCMEGREDELLVGMVRGNSIYVGDGDSESVQPG